MTKFVAIMKLMFRHILTDVHVAVVRVDVHRTKDIGRGRQSGVVRGAWGCD